MKLKASEVRVILQQGPVAGSKQNNLALINLRSRNNKGLRSGPILNSRMKSASSSKRKILTRAALERKSEIMRNIGSMAYSIQLEVPGI